MGVRLDPSRETRSGQCCRLSKKYNEAGCADNVLCTGFITRPPTLVVPTKSSEYISPLAGVTSSHLLSIGGPLLRLETSEVIPCVWSYDPTLGQFFEPL
jgi:hypothetical protein